LNPKLVEVLLRLVQLVEREVDVFSNKDGIWVWIPLTVAFDVMQESLIITELVWESFEVLTTEFT
jgi:hypothetical protein